MGGKRTSVFSGYRWISIKSWQQVEARQTESESSSGQMEEKHKNGQKGSMGLGIFYSLIKVIQGATCT